MFLFSLVWSWNWWPPAPQTMTGEPNLPALQLGFANARTLQDKLGIPAIVFGLVQSPCCSPSTAPSCAASGRSRRSTSSIRQETAGQEA